MLQFLRLRPVDNRTESYKQETVIQIYRMWEERRKLSCRQHRIITTYKSNKTSMHLMKNNTNRETETLTQVRRHHLWHCISTLRKSDGSQECLYDALGQPNVRQAGLDSIEVAMPAPCFQKLWRPWILTDIQTMCYRLE